MQTVNDADYYLEPVIFRVENTLFRVPKEYLTQESTFFHDMFQLPRPPVDETGEEGVTDTNPICLPVSAIAFRIFVKILYSGEPNISEHHLSMQEWVNILDISRMWDMKVIRGTAVRVLEKHLENDPVQRWYLAKEYEIPDWTRVAIEELIRRNDPLGERELEMFGRDNVLEIAKARESCLPFYNRNNVHTPTDWRILGERGAAPGLVDITFEMPTDVTSRIQPLEIPSIDENRTQGAALQKSIDFYFEDVVFQVEDCLYKVNNRLFVQHSPVLRNDFAGRGFVQYTKESPYVIDSKITKGDFVSLLRLFFPHQKFDQSDPCHENRTMEEWMSILRLSVLWRMQELQDLAKQKLNASGFDHVHAQLRIAQECGFEEWFTSGMITLVTRHGPLSGVECAVLSNKLILEILSLRERVSCFQYSAYGERRNVRLLEQRGVIAGNVNISELVERVVAILGSN